MSSDINYIKLENTESTNSYLSEHAAELPHGTVVYTESQSAGRGQRGNSWESQPGKNITMSMLLKDTGVAPANQFELSEICALAVAFTLEKYISGVAIKWPNDIYYKDSKICGILIEHNLCGGKIAHTVAGIGLNVNQRKFVSNAPNPVSLVNIIGQEIPVEKLIRKIAEEMLTLCAALSGDEDILHRHFLRRLYRREGVYSYRANIESVSLDGSETIPQGNTFTAEVVDVEPNGMLMLRTQQAIHAFAFKEISFILPSATL